MSLQGLYHDINGFLWEQKTRTNIYFSQHREELDKKFFSKHHNSKKKFKFFRFFENKWNIRGEMCMGKCVCLYVYACVCKHTRAKQIERVSVWVFERENEWERVCVCVCLCVCVREREREKISNFLENSFSFFTFVIRSKLNFIKCVSRDIFLIGISYIQHLCFSISQFRWALKNGVGFNQLKLLGA